MISALTAQGTFTLRHISACSAKEVEARIAGPRRRNLGADGQTSHRDWIFGCFTKGCVIDSINVNIAIIKGVTIAKFPFNPSN